MDRKNNCNQRHKQNHGNGFLLGIIVGVILTLLFTTKKGREIVKELTEKGLDKLSDLQGVMNEATSEVKDASKVVVANAVASASDMEEELVELIEDKAGDYLEPELRGEDVSGVAADSFGESISEEPASESSVTEANAAAVKESKEERHERPKAEHKAEQKKEVAAHHVKAESNGEAKGPKRFFLRKVKRS